jgi:hypothetical protein
VTRSVVAFPIVLPGARPKHPLATCPPRVVWVIPLIGWLAALGWNAQEIGPLLLFFAPAPLPPQEQA